MKALIVIDMQNDFVMGNLGTPEARDIVPKIKAKIRTPASNPYNPANVKIETPYKLLFI